MLRDTRRGSDNEGSRGHTLREGTTSCETLGLAICVTLMQVMLKLPHPTCVCVQVVWHSFRPFSLVLQVKTRA